MLNKILSLTCILFLGALTPALAKTATAKKLDLINQEAALANKTINLHLNVPGLFVGWAGGGVDFKIAPDLTLGPIAKYFAYGASDGFALGLNLNYALNGAVFTTGWVLNPYLEYYQSDYDRNYQASSAVAGINLAHQWFWDNGINIKAGVGLAYSTMRLPLGIAGSENIHPNLDLSLGYAF